MRLVNKVIVHCADTPNNMDIGVSEIREWHVKGRGWKDVGYHYIIRRSGTIEVGRQESVIGAHCYGQNKTSIGICLVGRDRFTREQFRSLKQLIDELGLRYDLTEVTGHYKYSDKPCPNINVEGFLESYE